MLAIVIAALSLTIWMVLVFARGRFWALNSGVQQLELCGGLPRIAVLIPARNESQHIEPVLESLLNQDYAGEMKIIVVDDSSYDDTRRKAMAMSLNAGHNRLEVSTAPSVPAGWKGKLWALDHGIHAAKRFQPEYFLFADADIVHSPDGVRSLIACAECHGYDLVSYMVKLRCETFAERVLIPAFTFFFFMLYPPAWVADSKRRTAAAAGGCALIRASALLRIGGIGAIHDALIDDCALAACIKRSGGRVWLGQNGSTCSIRSYATFAEIYRLISRTAFTQLNHSGLFLLGTVLAMTVTYLLPPIMFFLGGWAAIIGGTTWLIMSAVYWPTLGFYSRSPLWAPFLPVVALFYLLATLQSAIDYWRGQGGQWKGRVQDPIPFSAARVHTLRGPKKLPQESGVE